MSDAPTVLIAEDDAAARAITTRLLTRSGYRVLVAEDGARALALADRAVDIALIDWMMPGADGIEVCRRLKAATGGRAYVIMVTARGQKADVVHALESGADDYMIKPTDHGELLARIRAGERIAERERALAHACREARDEADRDGLTGLYSRRCFDRALLAQVQAIGPGAPLALLLLDLDHFKQINDRHGHAAGDEVLRRVAGAIAGQVRAGVDVAARYGGEELAVIAPRTSLAAACRMAERMRRSVAELRVPSGECLLSVTVSAGVASQRDAPENAETAARALVGAADLRLYQAKRAGRNRVAA